jgi:ubiquinone/menaquinone biosynthesis C-methylase UbiE
MTKSYRQSNLAFHLMSLKFRLRDWLCPPIRILREAGVCPGMTILDFGCGPGGFSLAAARLVGEKGMVYAVDIHPLAVKSVQKSAKEQRLKNIKTILQDGTVCLENFDRESIDMILLYDVLHGLSQPDAVLAGLHQVLRPEGILSVSDHHVKEVSLLSLITRNGFYRFTERSRKSMQFQKMR